MHDRNGAFIMVPLIKNTNIKNAWSKSNSLTNCNAPKSRLHWCYMLYVTPTPAGVAIKCHNEFVG